MKKDIDDKKKPAKVIELGKQQDLTIPAFASEPFRNIETIQKKRFVGQPKKFETPEDLQEAIERYFLTITRTIPLLDDEGLPILNELGQPAYTTQYFENPSVLGMCRHLETSRELLFNYEKDPAYFNTIKMAKAAIEEHVANKLDDRNKVVGAIFNLKNNFGWKDKTEVDTTLTVKTIKILDPMDDELFPQNNENTPLVNEVNEET